MPIRILLFFLSLAATVIFILFSYFVAKEAWQQIDFDTTVKLQDRIPGRFDKYFSLFSLLGSVEVTVSITLALSFLSLMRKRWLACLAWLLIFPATLAEVFGKLVLYHPAPPVFLHRSTQLTDLPSFYIHTDFSYPSGHMTRTVFLITALSLWVIFSGRSFIFKLLSLSMLMLLAIFMTVTRVYLGEHWLSDVLGGGLLGLSAGLFASIWILPKKSSIMTSLPGRG